jgi:Rieske Fe-S protein
MSRRKAIALLATGSVVAAGAVVAVNTNLLHMVNNTLKTPTTKAGNTATTNNNQQTAKTTPAKQQQTAAHTGTVVGSKTLALNSSQAFINPADKQASVLIHLPDGSFVAYERACTHVGVRVNYDPATHTLVCPAHGAVFDPANKGAVIQGPATKPLPSVTVQVNGDGTITTA